MKDCFSLNIFILLDFSFHVHLVVLLLLNHQRWVTGFLSCCTTELYDPSCATHIRSQPFVLFEMAQSLSRKIVNSHFSFRVCGWVRNRNVFFPGCLHFYYLLS